MARRGVYEPVHCWLPAYETVCFRHLRWIGPGAATWEDQHDLSNHPDIVVAARRHRQLIRAHRDLAGSALSEARHILTWWSRVNQDSGDDQTDPTTYLQAYPDLITIATVLADHRHQVAAGPCTRHPIWSEHLLGLINTHATTIRDDPGLYSTGSTTNASSPASGHHGTNPPGQHPDFRLEHLLATTRDLRAPETALPDLGCPSRSILDVDGYLVPAYS